MNMTNRAQNAPECTSENHFSGGMPPDLPRHSSSQCLLVSTVFGTVSPLHPTSFLMIFILVKNEVGCRDDTVPKTVDTRRHRGQG